MQLTKSLFWRRASRLPQTYFLVVGVGAAYCCFLFSLGLRPIVLLVGYAIAFCAIAAWLWKLKQINALARANVLDREIFLAHLTNSDRKLDRRRSYPN